MNTRLTRRTASTLRAALVLIAFTALAAVGFAATKSVRPISNSPAVTPAHTSPFHSAPAACPMPASAFQVVR